MVSVGWLQRVVTGRPIRIIDFYYDNDPTDKGIAGSKLALTLDLDDDWSLPADVPALATELATLRIDPSVLLFT